MIVALVTWSFTAAAITPEELEAALLAVETYREQRQAEGPPKLSMTQMKRTADGTVVTGLIAVGDTGTSKAYGAAVVDVPIATLWSAINDETRLPGWTATTYAELLVGKPCVDGRRVFQYIDLSWVADRWWIGVPTSNPTLNRNSGGSVRELTFRSSTDASEVTSASGQKMLALGEPIGFSKGAWFLVAVDARSTYLEYYVWTDPGGSIPASLASTFATKGVTNTISAIVSFAKGGNPSCPIE